MTKPPKESKKTNISKPKKNTNSANKQAKQAHLGDDGVSSFNKYDSADLALPGLDSDFGFSYK